MKVIEQFICSKTGHPSDGEDSLFVSENFAAVMDGATSKSTRKYNRVSPGRACSQMLTKALEDLPTTSTANQAVEYLTSAVFAMYTALGVEERVREVPSERASASIVLYSRFRNEIWMVGDCQCRVGTTVYSNVKPVDTLLSDIRSLFLQTELRLGKSTDELRAHDTGREFILPLLERQSLFQNSFEETGYRYGVIDGFQVPESEIKVVKLQDATSVILASDGYPVVCETLEESEAFLEKILRTDPLCFQTFKSTKGLQPGNGSFDDRAYLRIE